MRKVKGKGWIAVATTALALGVSIPTTILAASPQAIQAVLTSAKSSDFDDKASLASDEAIQTESAKALESITGKWSQNTLDQVKAEIERQKELGLEAYVVQWGDTLSVIAEAIESDVQELADANGISDRDLILTGDILNGVLSETESVVVSQAPAQTNNSNQVTPAQPSTPAPEAPKPVEPEPETPDTDKPVEENPDTDKPVEENPDTDKPVEENPDTDKPVEENPDTDKPVEENPDTDKPVEENPDTDKPVEENPDTDKPVEENPDTDKPVEENPDTDKPVEENPDTDKPVEEDPGTDKPVEENPDTDKPNTGEPTPETPAPEEPSEELPTEESVESEHVVGEATREVISTEDVDSEIVGREGEAYVEGVVELSEGPYDINSNDYQDPSTYEKVETEVPLLDEEGNPLLDEEGNQLFDVVIEEVEIPGAWHQRSVIYSTTVHTTSPGVRVIYDNTLADGVEVEDFAGVTGVRNVTDVQEVIDGETVEQFVDDVVVTEMQDRVIRLGTKPAGNIKETVKETQVITQGKKVIKDPNKWEDFVEVVPGKAGSIVKVYETLYTQDGEVLATVEVSEDVIEAEYDVTIVGTKPIKGQKTVTDTVAIPFETEVREVDSYGTEERVIQAGVNGSKVVTTTIHTEKGVEVSREVTGEEITKAPVNKIVEVGKANLATKEVKETEAITFKKVTRNNPDMLEGETKVVQQGKDGVMTYTYKVELKDGVEVSRQLLGEEITTSAVDEITEVGTKSRIQTQLRSEQESIDPTIIERNNPNMYWDEMNVVQEGSNGLLMITFEDTYEDGKLVGTKEIKREVKVNPVDRIIEVGTKLREGEQERDLDLVRQEFHRLLNEHRVSLGKSELAYYDEMQEGADLRAYEVREGGGHFSHTRPDGTSHSTVFSDIKDIDGERFLVGENVLYRAWYDHQSEQDAALAMFNQFKNSPGHYANMISDSYSGQALGLHVNEKQRDTYTWTYVSMAQSLIRTY